MALLDTTEDTYSAFLQDFERKGQRIPAVRNIVNPTREIRDRLIKISSAIDRYVEEITEAIEFPYSEILVTRRNISDLISQASPILDIPFDFILLLRETNRLLSQTVLAKPIFLSRSKAREAVINVFSTAPLAKKAYTIQMGDTLIGIARRLMPQISREEAVSQIIALNKLDYPYLVTDDLDELPHYEDHVVRPGDKIVVPNHATLPGNEVVPSQDELFSSLFGRDIELRTDSQSSFTSSTSTRFNAGTIGLEIDDVQSLEGIPNLAQSLINRILTDRGSLPLHPDYGASFARFVGLEATEVNATLAAFEVGRAVRQDPRINRVRNLKAEVVPEKPTLLNVSFIASVIGIDTPISLNLVVPRQ